MDPDRKALGKKPFDRDDDHKGGGSGGTADTTTKMQSTTDPDSGQQSRDGKPEGFHYTEHRTVDSAHNVIVNVHVEPANINDVTPMPEILKEIEKRLGKLPKYMGLDAGYHNAWIAHLLEKKDIQGVIGCRRHTHCGEHNRLYCWTPSITRFLRTASPMFPAATSHITIALPFSTAWKEKRKSRSPR